MGHRRSDRPASLPFRIAILERRTLGGNPGGRPSEHILLTD
jgi:hypothetical protein